MCGCWLVGGWQGQKVDEYFRAWLTNEAYQAAVKEKVRGGSR